MQIFPNSDAAVSKQFSVKEPTLVRLFIPSSEAGAEFSFYRQDTINACESEWNTATGCVSGPETSGEIDSYEVLLTLPGSYRVEFEGVDDLASVTVYEDQVSADVATVMASSELSCELAKVVEALECICEATNRVADETANVVTAIEAQTTEIGSSGEELVTAVEAQTEEINSSGEELVTAMEGNTVAVDAVAQAIIDTAQPPVSISSPLSTIEHNTVAANTFTLDIDPVDTAALLLGNPTSKAALLDALGGEDKFTTFADGVMTFPDGTIHDLAQYNETLALESNGFTLKFEDGEGGEILFDDGRISSELGNTIERSEVDGGLLVKELGIEQFSSINPIYIAHRQQSFLYPEHSMEGLTSSAAESFVGGLEIDAHMLSDGNIASSHNDSTGYISVQNSSIGSLSSPDFKKINYDSREWFGSKNNNYNTSLAQDIITGRNGRIVFAESKEASATQPLIEMAEKNQLKKNEFVIASFTLSQVLAVKSTSKYEAMYNNTSASTTDLQTCVDAGVEWLACRQDASSSKILSWISAGVKVVVYGVNTRYERDKFLALGVTGFYSDDIRYVASNVPVDGQSVALPDVGWPSGLIGTSISQRGEFDQDGWWGFPETVPNDRTFVLHGYLGAVSDYTEMTYEFDYIIDESTESDRWLSVFLHDEVMGDARFADGGSAEYGAHVLMQHDSDMSHYDITGGSANKSAEWSSTIPEHVSGAINHLAVTHNKTTNTLKSVRTNASGGVISELVSNTPVDYKFKYITHGRRHLAFRIKNNKLTLV